MLNKLQMERIQRVEAEKDQELEVLRKRIHGLLGGVHGVDGGLLSKATRDITGSVARLRNKPVMNKGWARDDMALLPAKSARGGLSDRIGTRSSIGHYSDIRSARDSLPRMGRKAVRRRDARSTTTSPRRANRRSRSASRVKKKKGKSGYNSDTAGYMRSPSHLAQEECTQRLTPPTKRQGERPAE
mmetsp:Transcript_23441/g.50882  ORF Transcript_23441/g.50882 Transcript_23441/m.50882 type:complete len:186 (-) Transcript_23441:134-691(-)